MIMYIKVNDNNVITNTSSIPMPGYTKIDSEYEDIIPDIGEIKKLVDGKIITEKRVIKPNVIKTTEGNSFRYDERTLLKMLIKLEAAKLRRAFTVKWKFDDGIKTISIKELKEAFVLASLRLY